MKRLQSILLALGLVHTPCLVGGTKNTKSKTMCSIIIIDHRGKPAHYGDKPNNIYDIEITLPSSIGHIFDQVTKVCNAKSRNIKLVKNTKIVDNPDMHETIPIHKNVHNLLAIPSSILHIVIKSDIKHQQVFQYFNDIGFSFK